MNKLLIAGKIAIVIHLSMMLSLMLCGCTNRNPSAGKEFATPVNLKKNDKVSVFDFFSKIEIIPLETTSHSLMACAWGEPAKTIMNEGNYYFLDRSMIFIFDSEGNFLKKIDRRGKGPEEYISISDFNINRFNNNIEILSERGRYINVYDSTGDRFIERIQLPNEIPVVYFFQHVTPDVYVFYSWVIQPELIFYSRTDHEIIRGRYKLPEWVGGTAFSSHKNPFYLLNDTLCFEQIYNGDIFTICPMTYELNPRYGWDFGRYNLDVLALYPEDYKQPQPPSDFYEELQEKSSVYATHFSSNKENSGYYITHFFFKGGRKHIVLDKATAKHFVFENFTEGVPLFPDWIDEESVYTILVPELLNFVNTSALDEENKRKYHQIKDDDNPIVVKYTFK